MLEESLGPERTPKNFFSSIIYYPGSALSPRAGRAECRGWG